MRVARGAERQRVNHVQKVVPMIHVPDVRATIDWYTSIGLNSSARYGVMSALSWKRLTTEV